MFSWCFVFLLLLKEFQIKDMLNYYIYIAANEKKMNIFISDSSAHDNNVFLSITDCINLFILGQVR